MSNPKHRKDGPPVDTLDESGYRGTHRRVVHPTDQDAEPKHRDDTNYATVLTFTRPLHRRDH